mgnify:CR=1 FL=1
MCEDRTQEPAKDVEGKYPRIHECMPCETELANSFEDAQLDVERCEQNAKKRRTMLMWRNAVEHTWETRPINEIRKLIDRQPKIQQALIDAEGACEFLNYSAQHTATCYMLNSGQKQS